MSFQNFFFTFVALRIAKFYSDGAQHRAIRLSTYRSFVRQFAQEFGDQTLGEVSDAVMIGPVELRWKRSCLDLKTYDLQASLWRDLSDMGEFLEREFSIKLTSEGRELHSEMEDEFAASRTIKQESIGFHAGS